MTKKVLMLAAKANMIQQFNHRNIKILQDLGYEVHVATNMVDFGSMSAEENERFKQWMTKNNVIAHQVDFERRMGSIKGNIKSTKQLNQLFKQYRYSFIHVHSPLGGILGRIVAKKFKVPVIYTAHGFHFFKGGPKSSWIFFFPLEWTFSFITDTLITINREDFEIANKYMHSKNIVSISGNGVGVERAWSVSEKYKTTARYRIRKELGIPRDAYVISSIGELSDRKNHKIVLEALNDIDPKIRKNIYYIVAGTGDNAAMLREFAKKINFDTHFKLLGYRNDIHEINYASDLFVFPSLREGLGIAGLEASIDGVNVIGTSNGGVSDYIKEGINGQLFDPNDSKTLAQLIIKNVASPIIVEHFDFLKHFDEKNVDDTIRNVYENM
ncbi:glycosyltransferase [Leuconostoc lactis]|uniref:glycosyltransferase n=1 Tax=Leuconostoc lactis TaxID=1246 RepID=UPI0021BFCD25|nr:glycosyltransferase [Leuconostoc lactis]MCT8388158.1 glycosyltransferase [Leuconostoc lactis]